MTCCPFQTRAKEKERELQRAFADKERQLQETQLTVAKKLGEAEQKITSLHSALESAQSELFEVKSKYDEATSAKNVTRGRNRGFLQYAQCTLMETVFGSCFSYFPPILSIVPTVIALSDHSYRAISRGHGRAHTRSPCFTLVVTTALTQ
ncbi:hypothetical protein RRG08_056892 [Elysia crispata]|uniref:Uncharacterized protein n=1 Tax=Elysia crispata TaxID=231223 RepID=A0AAE0ZCC5_9GAST|nr:hypothetical protein RRG08_056892 [Elysia crispata]